MKEKILILIVLLFLINPLVRAETKPVYLILFEKEVKSELVQDLINKKQHQFSFKIESLIDLKIPNDPTALTKYFNSISNLEYVLFMGNLKPRTETIDFPEYGYQARLNTDFFVDDLPIGRWPFNISVPVVTEKESLEKFSAGGIFPVMDFKTFTGNRKGKNWQLRGFDLRPYGEKIKKDLSNRKLAFTTLYEIEGLSAYGEQNFNGYPKPDFPLGVENSLQCFNDNEIVFVGSSGCPMKPYNDDATVVLFDYFSSPTRSIWVADKNSNKYADNDELVTEKILPVEQITKKDNRIVFLTPYLDNDNYLNTVAQTSLLTIVPKSSNRVTQLPAYVADVAQLMTDNSAVLDPLIQYTQSLPDQSLGKFIFSLLPETYQGKSNTALYQRYKYSVISLEIYGDPSVDLSELTDIPRPQLVLKPETVDRNLLIVLGKKNSYELTLQNGGQLDLKWEIAETPNFIKTNKIRGTIKPNKETVITLTLKEVESLIAPKTQTGIFVLETNDPDRKSIRIKIKLII